LTEGRVGGLLRIFETYFLLTNFLKKYLHAD
jgi:hypothetical protein